MSITPEARDKLAGYLRFQRDFGVETVRIAAAALTTPATSGSDPEKRGEPHDKGRAAAAVPGEVPVAEPGGESLAAIQAEIGADCQRCKLSQCGRHHIVFGDGPPHAELVFVGEAPGADEDAQGIPFVGRGGQLLNDMIQKGMGLRRQDVYICNVAKCRPPGNRTPERDEIAACLPFLWRQLRALHPRLVVALGSTAAQALHPFKGALASVRGTIHPLRLSSGEGAFETHLVVTYHPAYLLRDPSQKREAWKDLQLAMGFLGLPGPR